MNEVKPNVDSVIEYYQHRFPVEFANCGPSEIEWIHNGGQVERSEGGLNSDPFSYLEHTVSVITLLHYVYAAVRAAYASGLKSASPEKATLTTAQRDELRSKVSSHVEATHSIVVSPGDPLLSDEEFAAAESWAATTVANNA